MKYKIILFFLFIAGSFFSGIQAQVKQVTIIDELEKSVSGEGVVKITADPKIKELIGLLSPEISTDKENFITAKGFRIQVFMSNDSRTARREIVAKRNLIREVFSDSEIAVYDDYVAPNWKLLAGDFLTREEADVFKQKLQKTIPQLGKEMYVVSYNVKIPIQKNN